MHLLPVYNNFEAQSSLIPRSTLEHSDLIQQMLDLNNATGEKVSGETTINEQTERPYDLKDPYDL